MCKFFSFVSRGDGIPMFFNWKQRKQILAKKLRFENNLLVTEPDSHTSIAEFHGYVGRQEDVLNKYEYNPFTRVFTIDQINNEVDDSWELKKWAESLDFKTIVEPLILKEIVNPFKKFPEPQTPSVEDVKNLKKWASVWDSVGDSVWNSMWDSVGDSVWDSVGDSVRDSMGDSVWDSMWDSVGDSVWDSMRDSVRAYCSSFVKIKYPHNLFSYLTKLWKRGFVPSFDGKNWRLHSGKNAEIVWEGKF